MLWALEAIWVYSNINFFHEKIKIKEYKVKRNMRSLKVPPCTTTENYHQHRQSSWHKP